MKAIIFAFFVALSAVGVQAGGGWFDELFPPPPKSCEKSLHCQHDNEICYQRVDGKFCLFKLAKGKECYKSKHPRSVCDEGLECKYNHFWDIFNPSTERTCKPIKK